MPLTPIQTPVHQADTDATSAERLIAGLKRSYASDTYTDFTIECSGKEFRVHRVVLASRSRFFADAFDKTFKDVKEQRMSLPDDRPDIIEKLIRYCYGALPFTDLCNTSHPASSANSDKPFLKKKFALTLRMIDMYSAAQRYAIPELGDTVRRNLQDILADGSDGYVSCSPQTTQKLVNAVYTKTTVRDSLRDLINEFALSQELPAMISHFLDAKLFTKHPDLLIGLMRRTADELSSDSSSASSEIRHKVIMAKALAASRSNSSQDDRSSVSAKEERASQRFEALLHDLATSVNGGPRSSENLRSFT